MAVVFDYIQYALGSILYCIRGHDKGQIINCPAFEAMPEPNMKLDSPECGPSGSEMLAQHTCLADDGCGRLPELRWTAPANVEVKEYVLVCEDVDPPIPFWVVLHGLFFSIPPTVTTAYHEDIEHDKDAEGRLTLSGWRYVPNMLRSSYIGAAAPLGHGVHRYIYTIIALNEPLQFKRPDRVTRSQIKEAISGKIVGWGQWIGHFERPWPR